MGNNLRCCLACILPCGALDVIRIVHLNGHVEELSHPILVKEVINANPNHVLTKPCSSQGGVGHKILILSPNSELKRGHFYFLIPASSIPNNKSTNSSKKKKPASKLKIKDTGEEAANSKPRRKGLSAKKKSHHDRRQIGIWRPNLESICEDQWI